MKERILFKENNNDDDENEMKNFGRASGIWNLISILSENSISVFFLLSLHFHFHHFFFFFFIFFKGK